MSRLTIYVLYLLLVAAMFTVPSMVLIWMADEIAKILAEIAMEIHAK